MKCLMLHCDGNTPLFHEIVFLGVKTKRVKTAQIGEDYFIYGDEDHYIFEITCSKCGKKRKCWMTPSDESCDDLLDCLILPEDEERVRAKLKRTADPT